MNTPMETMESSDAVRTNAERAAFVPDRVYLRLTQVCNARCDYCPSWQMPRVLPEEARLRAVVEQIAASGARELRLTGGEAVLHPAFFPVVRTARSAGMAVSVITNGTLFAPRYRSALDAAGLAVVLVSLDAADTALHDTIRGIDGLSVRIRDGVARLAEAGVRLEINRVVCRDTLHDLPATFQFAAEAGAAAVHLLPVKDTPHRALTLAQIRAHNAQRVDLVALTRHLALSVTPPDLDLFGTGPLAEHASANGRYPLRHLCHVPTFEAFVDAVTGLVWPCNSTPYGARNGHTCGDLAEASFAQIWNGRVFAAIRAAHLTGAPVACSDRCDPANHVNSEAYRARAGR